MGEQAGLTVVTWNAQGSRGRGRRARGRRRSRRSAPDLVLLQEIQRRQLGALRVRVGDDRRAVAVQALAGPGARPRGSGSWPVIRWPTPARQVLAHRWAVLELATPDRAARDAARRRPDRARRRRAPRRRRRPRRAGAPGACAARRTRAASTSSPATSTPSRRRAELDVFAAAGWNDAETRSPRAGDAPARRRTGRPGPGPRAPTQRLDYLLVPRHDRGARRVRARRLGALGRAQRPPAGGGAPRALGGPVGSAGGSWRKWSR